MRRNSTGEMTCIYRLFNVLVGVVVVTHDPGRYGEVGWNDAIVFDPLARTVRRTHRKDVESVIEKDVPFTLERSYEGDKGVLRLLDADGKEVLRIAGNES